MIQDSLFPTLKITSCGFKGELAQRKKLLLWYQLSDILKNKFTGQLLLTLICNLLTDIKMNEGRSKKLGSRGVGRSLNWCLDPRKHLPTSHLQFHLYEKKRKMRKDSRKKRINLNSCNSSRKRSSRGHILLQKRDNIHSSLLIISSLTMSLLWT